jgi:TonB family protein
MNSGCRLVLVALFFLSALPLAAQDEPEVYNLGPGGASAPVVKREVKPDYTPEARAAGIEGEVQMNAVVISDGTVGEVTVTRSLDSTYGLDEQAVKATKRWLFEPGKKDGKPVVVRLTIEMRFTLKN